MLTHIKNLIYIIKTGSPAEVKFAQKQVEKFWHDYYIPHRKEGQLALGIFLDELKKLEEIEDVDYKAYFINTLKWPLWSTGEENFEVWAGYLLSYIQHPSGKIRQAVIHATQYLVMDMQLDLKHVGFEYVKLSKEQLVELVETNRRRFGYFVMAIEELAEQYMELKFNRYKYISSLPAGVYKSLNILLDESLLFSDYYKKLYKDFIKQLPTKSM